MKSQDIRKKFKDYFKKNNHKVVTSSSLVPENDPTLIFANAGMNQFKDYFIGNTKSNFSKATSSQKCVRAGGKHNDLEEVGVTARHHTFFEMLGNFSFGDYFKKEAINYAYKFLTQELKISLDKLYFTVYEDDDEAYNIWHQNFNIPQDRIFRMGKETNFWEMGEYGPCGPCSEIFFDHGEKFQDPHLKGKKLTNILDDESRYVEIWNLVFMQYEKTKKGIRPLPSQSVDTGMGLERIAAAMQGVYWNYDTDLFRPIIKKIEQLTSNDYKNPKYTTAMRVLADHSRSASFLITDGVMPSNDGRGYVLRRIIRRATRFIQTLGYKGALLHKLVPEVFDILGEEFPQNLANIKLAETVIQREENKFLETLEYGLKYFNDALENQIQNGVFSGKAAFKLYDTYGLPIDLTQLMLKEHGLELETTEFAKCLEEQKTRSKKSSKSAVFEGMNEEFAMRLSKHPISQFIGYKKHTFQSKLLDCIEIPGSEFSYAIFDKTPFYPESGGQIGDSGEILIKTSEKSNIIKVYDTQKSHNNIILHSINKEEAQELYLGETYQITIDQEKRKLITKNHTATHILQKALIETLGEHIKQAGSFVSHEKLRLDFTHDQALSKKQLNSITKNIQKIIAQDIKVSNEEVPKEEALKRGALAFFGDKYGDLVRIVEVGDYSLEFCGGTHVERTGEIALFLITQETSISSGIRRIEAITSKEAAKTLFTSHQNLQEVEELLKAKGNALNKVIHLKDETKALHKEIDTLKEKLTAIESKNIFSSPEKIGKYFLSIVKIKKDQNIKSLSDHFISNIDNKGLALIYSENPKDENKYQFLLRSHSKFEEIDACSILKKGLESLNGRGGGRKDMAQGQGDKSDLTKFFSIIKNEIREI